MPKQFSDVLEACDEPKSVKTLDKSINGHYSSIILPATCTFSYVGINNIV